MKEQLKNKFNELFIESVIKKDGLMEDWLNYGADINAKNEAGMTALMIASKNRDSKLVKKLIEKGADVNITEYYTSAGEQITLNTGKTYVALVSTNRWKELVLKK